MNPNPNSISPAELALILSTSGGRRITTEMIEADVADGAPTNADGTLNLIEYAAWLLSSRDN